MDVVNELRASNVEAREFICAWLAEAKDAEWNSQSDVKKVYPTATFPDSNEVVFRVKEKCCVGALISYEKKTILVRRLTSVAELSSNRESKNGKDN